MPSRLARCLVVSFVVFVAASRPLVVHAQQPATAASPAHAPAAPCTAPALPPNIVVAPVLMRTVSSMLTASPTFRRQCERIGAAPGTRVNVLATPPPRDQTAPRARARITRHAFGALRATIEIPITGDYAELIGHEFEHVIEQIEGIDVPALNRAGDHAVTEVQAGVYETVRAAAAGRLIEQETLSGPDRSGDATMPGVTLTVRDRRPRVTRTSPPTSLWRR